jgi:DDE superfamily endonuclease
MFISLLCLVTASFCDDIAKMRRWCQRISNDRLIFLDETALKLNECPSTTLVMPGETDYVVVEDDTSYSARYDMIGCCTGNEMLPPIVYSPEDRAAREVDGIRGWMINDYIEDILARSISALDRYPMYLIIDRAKPHNKQQMMEAFHNGGCFEIVDIIYMPTKSAKRLSPLDNAIWHEMKEKVRRQSPLTSNNVISNMMTAYHSIIPKSYYRLCGLTHGQSVYKDCPSPSAHRHSSRKYTQCASMNID